MTHEIVRQMALDAAIKVEEPPKGLGHIVEVGKFGFGVAIVRGGEGVGLQVLGQWTVLPPEFAKQLGDALVLQAKAASAMVASSE